MKRFTDTDIWDRVWFRKLSNRLKSMFRFLCDRCDPAGVMDADWEAVSFYVGEPCTEEDLKQFNGNAVMREGKIYLPQFIEFQYGQLSHECKPHEKVFEAMRRHNLVESDLFRHSLPAGRIDRATPAKKSGGNGSQSVYALTKIIEAKETVAAGLKDKYASSGALDTTWTDEGKRAEYRKLRGEIKALQAQIAGMA